MTGNRNDIAAHPSMLTERHDLVVCDECDAVHRRIELPPGQVAQCLRCGALLGRGHIVPLQGLLAFAVAALACLSMGNLAPFVTLDLNGVASRVTLLQAMRYTAEAGQPWVALLAAATCIVFPLAVILLRLYILVPMLRGRLAAGFVPAMHALGFATRWSMVEVFLLAALVAVVRSAGLANVVPGVGLFAYVALTLLLTSITAAGLHTLWNIGNELRSRLHAA